MSEKLPEVRSVLALRKPLKEGDPFEVDEWTTTSEVNDKGLHLITRKEEKDGVSYRLEKYVPEQALSDEAQADFALLNTRKDLGGTSLKSLDVESPAIVVEKDALDTGSGKTHTETLNELLKSREADVPKESAEAKGERIAKQTINEMRTMLNGVFDQAESARHSGNRDKLNDFNGLMIQNISNLKARIDNGLVTPEGAAMMAGVFIGAMTEAQFTSNALRTLDQRGLMDKNDVIELQQVLNELESVSRNPADTRLRWRVIDDLKRRSDQALSAQSGANKKLSAAYTGLATAVTFGIDDGSAISNQNGAAMHKLSTLQ